MATEGRIKKGKFFVLDGIDGSGKTTQAELLIEELNSSGHKTVTISFSQYGSKSAGLVEEYLAGKFGSAEEVGPYRASVFYACDRYAASFQIKEWLDQGKIVVADRYTSANLGHQGGKIKDLAEWKKYVEWIFELEYGLFAIPKPDLTILIKTNPELALDWNRQVEGHKKLEREYLGKVSDIHENLQHQLDAQESFVRLAKFYSDDFVMVDRCPEGAMLEAEQVHQMILEKVLAKF